MNSSKRGSEAFKLAAMTAIKKSSTFCDLLAEFPNKLPSQEIVASRLENQKKFNPDRAKQAAKVLEQSLRYAVVLDGNNNILPIRADENAVNGDTSKREDLADEDDSHENPADTATPTLSVEIPIGTNRKVAIRYPHDLTGEEAQKVGNVLKAIVS